MANRYVDTTSAQSIGGVKSFTSNVGIGTSPLTPLHIKLTSNPDSIIENDNNSAIRIDDTSTSAAPRRGISWYSTSRSTTLAAIETYVNSGWPTDLLFMTNNNGSSGNLSTKLIIKASGNVGIGTISPSQKLDVAGSIKASSWLRTTGNYGWHNDSHGGGIYMTDNTYVRVYGAKRFLNDKADQYAFYATNGGVTSKSGFYKIGENNSSVLLAGGGHATLSGLSGSHSHNDYVTKASAERIEGAKDLNNYTIGGFYNIKNGVSNYPHNNDGTMLVLP